MTEKEQLLAAIIAAPKEDTVRLVYADWLQENGDPDRAELIRWQIASGVGYAYSRYGWREEVKRASVAALPAGAARARDGLLAGPVPRTFIVRRGFVHVIRPSAVELAGPAMRVFRTHPVVRVEVAGRRPFPSSVNPGAHAWVRQSHVGPSGLHTPANLPPVVFDMLEDYAYRRSSIRYYRTVKDANAALNRAAFALGVSTRVCAPAA